MSDRRFLAEARVRGVWRRVAWQLAVAAVTGVAAALGGLLVLGWLAAGSPIWQRPSPAPLVLWLLALGAAALWLGRVGWRALGWDRRRAAAEIETSAGLSRGSLQGAVEPWSQRPGISRALLDLHRLRLADRLEGRPAALFAGRTARAARRYAAAGLLLGAAVMAGSAAIWIGARESATRAWAAVWHPIRHLEAPPLPTLHVLTPGDRVRRGRDLPVLVHAPLRDSVTLHWRARGEMPTQRRYAVELGRARGVVPRLTGPTDIWATAADGAVSDTLHVEPVDPLLLIDVQVDLRFPPHTRREREVISSTAATISVPEGTWATVRGKTTLPIAEVALGGEGGRRQLFRIVDDRRFRASFTVVPGAWGWQVRGARGEVLEGEPDSLRFATVPDSAPQVAITFPGVDTVLSTEMTQPLLVEARDDYGLSRVELVSWRVSAWGERWPEQVEDVPLPGDVAWASLAPLIDARGRGFLPGDTLHYYVRVFDNAPEPAVGKSREYVLRLPTLDEVRERALARARDLVDDAEDLAERARDHQRASEALERSGEVQPPPGVRRAEARGEAVEFRDTEAARRTLEEADGLLEKAEEIQESLRELQRAIEQAGLDDSTLLERLREIQSLYERVLTPELRERMDALREALAELDPQQIREAVRRLAEGGAEFRERVERSVELLRRAALEQRFATLETEAREQAEAQERLAQEMEAAADESDLGRAERLERQASELAARAEQLAERIEEFTGELERAGEGKAQERAREAERAAGEAAAAERDAANAVSSRRRDAIRASKRAASEMRRAASALQAGRQQMQADWRGQLVEALQRAQTEALELARRQREVAEALREGDRSDPARQRSEQGALRRGVEQIEQQLTDASASSLLLDPDLVEMAAQVGQAMDELLGEMADGTRRGGVNPDLAEQAAEALHELAYRAMQAGEAASVAQSGTGLAEALEQLGRLAEQQGALTDQTGGLMPSPADILMQELQRLAGRQRAIAEELEGLSRSIGSRGQVLGRVDELAREAEDLAAELERGRLDERMIQRQERLFHRLLDAGRTLERDEFERERRAERPDAVDPLRPGELPPELLRGPRYPHPDDEALRPYPPALRRLILEYFDRLNGRGGADGP